MCTCIYRHVQRCENQYNSEERGHTCIYRKSCELFNEGDNKDKDKANEPTRVKRITPQGATRSEDDEDNARAATSGRVQREGRAGRPKDDPPTVRRRAATSTHGKEGGAVEGGRRLLERSEVWKIRAVSSGTAGDVVRVEGCSHGKGPGGRVAVGVEGRAGVLVCCRSPDVIELYILRA